MTMRTGWKRKLAAMGAAITLATLGVAGAGAGTATADEPQRVTGTKVPVWHVPATGITVSGLLVPTPWLAVVYASSDQPGTVTFSVGGGSLCSTNAAYRPVQLHWANVSNGRTGVAHVQPCSFGDPNYPGLFTTAATGSGPVAITLIVPAAAPATLPGVGGLLAP
ncbi:hypothetical protein GS4_26_00350 [Gordonia soli NBRC 108243]|uniref:Uncharacterized protein n=1 Tax=Gordonia soli NBRC 108243 TaxID=1223545 RepID=M0QQ59_9ACTN|nr:hypothetical protein GS4_26_00350 [Gordonia soli NBRC 108243]